MTEDLPVVLAGDDRAARTLLGALNQRSAHAFMLCGPAVGGVGAWIARRLLCPDGGCGRCAVCGRVDRRTHPDLLWVSAEGLQLRADQIGALVDVLDRTPFEATCQVAVIDDAETLSASNKEAANRILKALEEPTGDVVFVLLARTAAPVLPTIRSRVLEIPLPRRDGHARTPAQERRRALVDALAMDLARGTVLPGDAAALLLDEVRTAERAAVEAAEAEFAEVREQLPEEEAKRFATTKDPEGHEARAKRRGRRAASEELRALLHEQALWYRDLLAVASGANDTVVDPQRLERLCPLRDGAAARNAVAAIDAIDELVARLVTNPELGIALDALCGELMALAEGRVRSRRSIGVAAV